jgi:hypothetical protein
MKKSLIFPIVASAMLASCSYTVMPSKSNHSTPAKTATSCSYAPLWLAPMNSEYANVDKISKENHINEVSSVKLKNYPFVLFTKSCVIVEGK